MYSSPMFCLFSADGWINTDSGEYKVFNINYHGVCSKDSGCSWEDSNRVCEKEGGYLAKITSQTENDQVEALISRIDPAKNKYFFHLGLNDIAVEGEYRWVSDDSKISFDNFYRGKSLSFL